MLAAAQAARTVDSSGQKSPPAQVVSEAAGQHRPLQEQGVKKRVDPAASPPIRAAPPRAPAPPKTPGSVEDRLLNLVEAGKAT